uniref:OO_Ba0013J05-OO_Ba0033A15.36 protein n=1 Tax=Oryza officinalis TaxID=4535 RepID=D0ABH9_9ORYZ|nr:OO_Ba0013J05-OO_Ba0033A15.36 [Oryza officinalis]
MATPALVQTSIATLPLGSPSRSALPTRTVVVWVSRDCDIFCSEWVPAVDGAAPYYANMTCTAIQKHQNCMKYGRPDLRGKSLVFVADSLARNHMQSLMCLLSKVEYPKDVLTTMDPEFKTVLYESRNFTIMAFRLPYLVKANQLNLTVKMWDLYLVGYHHCPVPSAPLPALWSGKGGKASLQQRHPPRTPKRGWGR